MTAAQKLKARLAAKKAEQAKLDAAPQPVSEVENDGKS